MKLNFSHLANELVINLGFEDSTINGSDENSVVANEPKSNDALNNSKTFGSTSFSLVVRSDSDSAEVFELKKFASFSNFDDTVQLCLQLALFLLGLIFKSFGNYSANARGDRAHGRQPGPVQREKGIRRVCQENKSIQHRQDCDGVEGRRRWRLGQVCLLLSKGKQTPLSA